MTLPENSLRPYIDKGTTIQFIFFINDRAKVEQNL